MGSYTVIADAGNALVKLLRREMVPNIILNDDGIGLASPADKGDLTLCIHLYDISESEEYRMSGMISDGVDRQKFPPTYLTLSYLITAFSASDVKFRSEEEQRMLGKVIQVLRDYPMLDPDTMEFVTGSGRDGIRIEMKKIEMEEKLKVWTFPNLAQKLSLFYKMGPMPLESAKTKNVKRVRGVEFRTDYSSER